MPIPSGWDGVVVVTSLVTSVKLIYVDHGLVIFGKSTIPVYIQDTQVHSAWPPSMGIGAISTGDGFDHRWGRNGKLCVAAGPATRLGLLAAAILYCMLAQLSLTLWVKGQRG